MRIRAKLILSNIIVVAFSVLVVSLPVLFLQTRELKSNIEQSAIQNMTIASSDISAFLKKSKVIINDMASYLQANAVEEQTSINTFIDAISDDKSIFALYYVDTIPMRNGGIFYSSDYWLPEDDYDKTKKDISACNSTINL